MLELAIPTAEKTSPLSGFDEDRAVAPTPIVQLVPLKNLRAGQSARITRLIGSGHDVARLAEMGLRCGVEVTVIRNGITCILQLDGNRLCIRLSKDLVVLVTPA